MAKASLLDGYERRASSLFTKALPQNFHGKKAWKQQGNKGYSQKEYQGEPMEIDRLEPQEEKRRKENDLCFNCRKSGHRAKECRSQRNKGPLSQGHGNNKTPHQKKRNFQGN